MANKMKLEGMDAARKEDRKESKKFNIGESVAGAMDQQTQNSQTASEKKPDEPLQDAKKEAEKGFTIPPVEPERDEFQERYDEYFKSIGGFAAGEMIVGFIDGLKSDFLYLYAKKHGIEIEKTALLMDEKSKKFAAFLADEAIKKNFFQYLKKYPLLASLGVIVISGGVTFMMLQMLKKSNDASKQKDDIIEQLKREKQEYQRANAQTVSDENEVKTEKKPDEAAPVAESVEKIDLKKLIEAL